MTKILIPVELEDGKSCKGCPKLTITMGSTWECDAGYNMEHQATWEKIKVAPFMIRAYPKRPTRCIKELGGGE